MKNNLLPFILGCAFILLISAQGNLTQIFQPKKPTIVEVKSFRTMFFIEKDIKNYIDQKVKEGFIVKSVAMMDDEDWSKAIVVMEKY
jgi:hypothetical protein